MRITLFLLGVALALAGVAFIYWQAAVILGGLFIAFVAVRMDEPTRQAKGAPRTVSQADFNIN